MRRYSAVERTSSRGEASCATASAQTRVSSAPRGKGRPCRLSSELNSSVRSATDPAAARRVLTFPPSRRSASASTTFGDRLRAARADLAERAALAWAPAGDVDARDQLVVGARRGAVAAHELFERAFRARRARDASTTRAPSANNTGVQVGRRRSGAEVPAERRAVLDLDCAHLPRGFDEDVGVRARFGRAQQGSLHEASAPSSSPRSVKRIAAQRRRASTRRPRGQDACGRTPSRPSGPCRPRGCARSVPRRAAQPARRRAVRARTTFMRAPTPQRATQR